MNKKSLMKSLIICGSIALGASSAFADSYKVENGETLIISGQPATLLAQVLSAQLGKFFTCYRERSRVEWSCAFPLSGGTSSFTAGMGNGTGVGRQSGHVNLMGSGAQELYFAMRNVDAVLSDKDPHVNPTLEKHVRERNGHVIVVCSKSKNTIRNVISYSCRFKLDKVNYND